jgi:hypothetical protein
MVKKYLLVYYIHDFHENGGGMQKETFKTREEMDRFINQLNLKYPIVKQADADFDKNTCCILNAVGVSCDIEYHPKEKVIVFEPEIIK